MTFLALAPWLEFVLTWPWKKYIVDADHWPISEPNNTNNYDNYDNNQILFEMYFMEIIIFILIKNKTVELCKHTGL